MPETDGRGIAAPTGRDLLPLRTKLRSERVRSLRPRVLSIHEGDPVAERARALLTAPHRRRPAPVFVVCSARPRVGRTLLARLLTEFFLADGRPAIAVDANPNDRALSAFLPTRSVPADIADTRGQMALFDRLAANDGTAKIVDLGPELFHQFFELVRTLEFLPATRAQSIDTVALFVAENHPRSSEAYRLLRRDFAEMPLVPVHNEAVARPDFPRVGAAPSLGLSALSPLLQGVIDRPSFSFAEYLGDPANARTGLHAWIGRAFIGFRDLELRLSMMEVNRSFNAPLAAGG